MKTIEIDENDEKPFRAGIWQLQHILQLNTRHEWWLCGLTQYPRFIFIWLWWSQRWRAWKPLRDGGGARRALEPQLNIDRSHLWREECEPFTSFTDIIANTCPSQLLQERIILVKGGEHVVHVDCGLTNSRDINRLIWAVTFLTYGYLCADITLWGSTCSMAIYTC